MECGIVYVYDILDENGEFVSHAEITRKFDTGCHYNSVKAYPKSGDGLFRRV